MCEISVMAKHAHKLEPRALAKVLVEGAGLSVGYASDLAHGKTLPSLTLAVKLERDLKIPLRFWAERVLAKAA
jgi:transcriptional regulator with XRE-family HTH domain